MEAFWSQRHCCLRTAGVQLWFRCFLWTCWSRQKGRSIHPLIIHVCSPKQDSETCKSVGPENHTMLFWLSNEYAQVYCKRRYLQTRQYHVHAHVRHLLFHLGLFCQVFSNTVSTEWSLWFLQKTVLYQLDLVICELDSWGLPDVVWERVGWGALLDWPVSK